jgi:putative ubiquitin-RnfH superfamily antitoxin RatB of RatAB toxin-antitoxin module
MHVVVAYLAPGVELLVPLELPDGASVQDAVTASRIGERAGGQHHSTVRAIFGRPPPPGTPLEHGDRVEIVRPLACDPKAARRTRARRAGERR